LRSGPIVFPQLPDPTRKMRVCRDADAEHTNLIVTSMDWIAAELASVGVDFFWPR
jgi:hypothetical protein